MYCRFVGSVLYIPPISYAHRGNPWECVCHRNWNKNGVAITGMFFYSSASRAVDLFSDFVSKKNWNFY